MASSKAAASSLRPLLRSRLHAPSTPSYSNSWSHDIACRSVTSVPCLPHNKDNDENRTTDAAPLLFPNQPRLSSDASSSSLLLRHGTASSFHPMTSPPSWNQKNKHVQLQEQQQQIRMYHATSSPENASVALSLAAVALAAKGAQYGLRAYQEWKDSQPEPTEEDEQQQEQTTKTTTGSNTQDAKAKAKTSEERTNIFTRLFGFSVGSKYYEGGFEDKMTRREAALILGVRESSSARRIKDAHRKILILNHPDTGGSTYLASKINEAKELLLKGKE